MKSRFRTVVMCLLMAALPLQGLAAAAMLNCGPSHHRMATQGTGPDAAPHPAHGADHHGPASHAGHEHMGSPTPASAADPSENTSDHDPLTKLSQYKCSACASCCLGLALPSTIVSFDASVSSDTVEPGMPQAAAVFLTDGLERPPRPFLA
jgi:hypothetical protein